MAYIDIMQKKVMEALACRYANNSERERAEQELAVIEEMDIAESFLIAADFASYARNTNTAFMPRNISAFYVAYLLGITPLDPLEYGLVFQCFLRRERGNKDFYMDLDIESGGNRMRKRRAFRYMIKRYGNAKIDTVRNRVNGERPESACISFLALQALRHRVELQEFIAAECGDIIDFNATPYDDQKVYALFGAGKAHGIFQFEHNTPREIAELLKPKNLEDLTAVRALFMPGTIHKAEALIAQKNSTIPQHKYTELIPYLRDTYGVLLYQEQILHILHGVGNFSYDEAESVRMAMWEKRPADLNSYRNQFVHNGGSADVFDYLTEEVRYVTRKSHWLMDSLLSYQMAYLKTYYPKEFFAYMKENADACFLDAEGDAGKGSNDQPTTQRTAEDVISSYCTMLQDEQLPF